MLDSNRSHDELLAQVETLRAEVEALRVSGEDTRVSTRRTQVEHGQALDAAHRGWSEAERVGRLKDDFLANLSHELRTPINAILGWAQVLHSGRVEPGELAEGVEVIQRNARVQVRLIEDLLDMSRIISGKLRLDVQGVDLPAVINAALESVRPAADAKHIRIMKVL